MTVHKAKGLQFPVVLIPFFDWKIMPAKESLLWTSSDESPFSEAKKIPVRFGNSLADTIFREHHAAEVRNYVADSFNLMYVAFTRAMERLYIYSPPSKLPVEEYKSSKEILAASVSEISGKMEAGEFVAGEKSKPARRASKENAASVSMSEYISSEWRNKISIAEKNSRQSILVKERMKKIRYGSMAHRILASLKTIGDLEPELNKMFYAGLIDDESRNDLSAQIQKLFSNENIKAFFSGQWTTLAEREILMPDGKILRPDRVLLRDDNAVIVDFKTGKERPEHAMQVQEYAEQLSKMNYKKIEKFLVYLETARVIEV
jgi:ATP-dependent exoDNAse (exonuclease V) beta subunit